ncbi:MAG: 4Fe-4S binding protein [Rikenellaceae bacterium]
MTDSCIGCGMCKSQCSFDAITEGITYQIQPERCDDCGSCILVCPVGAIQESLVF